MKRRIGYSGVLWPLHPINEDLGHAESLRFVRGTTAPVINRRQILVPVDEPTPKPDRRPS